MMSQWLEKKRPMARDTVLTGEDLGLRIVSNCRDNAWRDRRVAYLEAKFGDGLAVEARLLRGSRRRELDVFDAEIGESRGSVETMSVESASRGESSPGVHLDLGLCRTNKQLVTWSISPCRVQ